MKTLLLNQSHEVLSFITFRRAIKLVLKEKVEVISAWNQQYFWDNGHIKHPAILRLKYYVNLSNIQARFSRRSVFRRDSYVCQYCGKSLRNSEATLDHIIPTSQGGKSTWLNSLTACLECNLKKANRTPEQAGLIPLSQPVIPFKDLTNEYNITKPKHDDWVIYFPRGRV